MAGLVIASVCAVVTYLAFGGASAGASLASQGTRDDPAPERLI